MRVSQRSGVLASLSAYRQTAPLEQTLGRSINAPDHSNGETGLRQRVSSRARVETALAELGQ